MLLVNVKALFQKTRWHFIVFMALVFTCSCQKPPATSFQGYVEGEFVYVASPLGGRLETLNARRGQTVKKGDLLFAL